mmetsp:Transcript_119061/g.342110  ORF Transcript_119061/g.342110 Transcript_119061/m.342110 type:complete len:248 (-) Transcript_119061:2902-3645(-)
MAATQALEARNSAFDLKPAMRAAASRPKTCTTQGCIRRRSLRETAAACAHAPRGVPNRGGRRRPEQARRLLPCHVLHAVPILQFLLRQNDVAVGIDVLRGHAQQASRGQVVGIPGMQLLQALAGRREVRPLIKAEGFLVEVLEFEEVQRNPEDFLAIVRRGIAGARGRARARDRLAVRVARADGHGARRTATGERGMRRPQRAGGANAQGGRATPVDLFACRAVGLVLVRDAVLGALLGPPLALRLG